MTDKYYVGDIGTDIIVDCGTAITGATSRSLKVTKPDGTIATWAASIDGTDNLLYTTIDGDFSLAGTYFLQAELSLGGWVGRGDTVKFIVHEHYA